MHKARYLILKYLEKFDLNTLKEGFTLQILQHIKGRA